jgi:methylmalonyl-CoA mutase cobalamin-binding domain/chain
MNLVCKRTGLSQHVIRVWEKRYGAVKPARSEGKRRLYSEEDVHRLGLFRQLTRAGHPIGSIAHLSTEDLEQLWRKENSSNHTLQNDPQQSSDLIFVRDALKAVEAMDRIGLTETLRKSALRFGSHGSLERVIAPLTEEIGEKWRTGELTAANEHFASVVIREYLLASTRAFVPTQNAPTLVVTTPIGQLHELGAVMVAAAASDVGWNVIYLGPSLPPVEIAAAAVDNRAAAVALSIVYPPDDNKLGKELALLRTHLPQEISIIAGGRATPAYREALNEIGALQPISLQSLYDELNRIRNKKELPK